LRSPRQAALHLQQRGPVYVNIGCLDICRNKTPELEKKDRIEEREIDPTHVHLNISCIVTVKQYHIYMIHFN